MASFSSSRLRSQVPTRQVRHLTTVPSSPRSFCTEPRCKGIRFQPSAPSRALHVGVALAEGVDVVGAVAGVDAEGGKPSSPPSACGEAALAQLGDALSRAGVGGGTLDAALVDRPVLAAWAPGVDRPLPQSPLRSTAQVRSSAPAGTRPRVKRGSRFSSMASMSALLHLEFVGLAQDLLGEGDLHRLLAGLGLAVLGGDVVPVHRRGDDLPGVVARVAALGGPGAPALELAAGWPTREPGWSDPRRGRSGPSRQLANRVRNGRGGSGGPSPPCGGARSPRRSPGR
jgi:hypothetical protein